jgi:hypothetical protein
MCISEMTVLQVEQNTNVTILNLVLIPNVELRRELQKKLRVSYKNDNLG